MYSCVRVFFVEFLCNKILPTKKEEEIHFNETHDSYKKLRQKYCLYNFEIVHQYNTIDNFIIIMVIGRIIVT